jgi:DNA-binding YbaB/EbfC family protein
VADTTPDMEGLVSQLQETHQRLALAQAELAETEVTRTAGGGLVRVTMKGNGEVTRVTFDPAVFDESDAESLGALTLAAINHATDAVTSVAAEKLAEASAGLQAGNAARGTSRPG